MAKLFYLKKNVLITRENLFVFDAVKGTERSLGSRTIKCTGKIKQKLTNNYSGFFYYFLIFYSHLFIHKI